MILSTKNKKNSSPYRNAGSTVYVHIFFRKPNSNKIAAYTTATTELNPASQTLGHI